MELLRRLEDRARKRLPAGVYDYFAGGAGDERTLRENPEAWRRWWIRPRVMVDVTRVETATTLLGADLALPVALAPIAAQRLLHPDGEIAAARAAGAAGTAFCLSTRATAGVDEVSAAAGGPVWFQLYVDPDRSVAERQVARAAQLGCRAIVLTVDLPVAGRRERERRHGAIAMPPGVRLTDHLGGHAPWEGKPLGGWDPTLTWGDVAWIAGAGGLPVVVKGVLSAEDARAALDAGADAIVVSNHGARQLDGVLPTAVALPEVAAAVAGRVPVLADGGIRDGGDVLRALALGADAVLVGRPYAWGLAADGEAGVVAVLAALAEDLRLAMALAGCPDLAAIDRDRVARATA